MATKAAGAWTYEDLFTLPDDGKCYEIIDGELYELPAPNPAHAIVITNLLLLLAPTVIRLGGRVLAAPLDVFLQGATPVQPDVIVLLPDNLGLISRRGVEGAPDLVVEVLSPGTAEHDRVTKRALYARAGVREYWLISPEAGSVEVLVLEQGRYRTLIRVAGDETVSSLALPQVSFPASSVFA